MTPFQNSVLLILSVNFNAEILNFDTKWNSMLMCQFPTILVPNSAYQYVWHIAVSTLLWRHNGRGSVSNHQPRDCLLNRLFRRGSKKTSKLRVTGLCAGNSPETGEFPAQIASNAENVSIWWRHHESLNWVSMLIDVPSESIIITDVFVQC